jgi:hypothetical protein
MRPYDKSERLRQRRALATQQPPIARPIQPDRIVPDPVIPDPADRYALTHEVPPAPPVPPAPNNAAPPPGFRGVVQPPNGVHAEPSWKWWNFPRGQVPPVRPWADDPLPHAHYDFHVYPEKPPCES